MHVCIHYVDGTTQSAAAHDWPLLRGEGVDRVDATQDGITERIEGMSIYWLYFSEGRIVIGGGGVGPAYGGLLTETVVGFGRRPLEYMPDLAHDQIKLGWWLPDG